MKIPVVLALVAAVTVLPNSVLGSGAKPRVSADAALQLLMAGNARFVAGKLMHPDQTTSRRAELAKGQKPYAIVLTCADSRVSPEIYFDQGLGDIFVLRNAGNILSDHVIGSIEYAVEHLGAGLIVVVGHSQCGAVGAAVAGGHAPGHIGSIVESILPAVEASKADAGDKLDNAVRTNARLVADALRKSAPILSEAAAHGNLRVVAARYDLASGKIDLLEGAAVAPVAHGAPAKTVAAHGAPAAH